MKFSSVHLLVRVRLGTVWGSVLALYVCDSVRLRSNRNLVLEFSLVCCTLWYLVLVLFWVLNGSTFSMIAIKKGIIYMAKYGNRKCGYCT